MNDQMIKFESACIDRLREYFSMNILTILPLRSLLLLNERSSIKKECCTVNISRVPQIINLFVENRGS